MDGFLAVLSRWLHIIPASLVIGGLVFMRLVLPLGLRAVDESTAQQVFLRCRRGFKMVIHTSIALLLLSGAYNSYRNWSIYSANPGLMHALWGMHILLALIAFGIALWLLTGPEPPRPHRTVSMVNLVLLLMLVALASTLKAVRERAMVHSSNEAPSRALAELR